MFAHFEFLCVRGWVIAALLCFSASLMAQAPLSLNDSTVTLKLDQPFLTLREDQTVSPFLLLAQTEFSTALFGESVSEGPHAYWYRLTFKGSFPDSTPRSFSLLVHSLVLQHLEFHLFDGQQLIASSALGVLDENLVNDSAHLGPVFKFSIADGQQRTLLIRKQSEGAAIFPATVYSEQAFSDYASRRNLFVGGVAIFLVIIALYNGVIGLLSRSRAYIWYLIFYTLTFVELSILLGFGSVLWPRALYVWLASHILVVNCLLLGVAVLFSSQFLVAKLYAPGYFRAAKYLVPVAMLGAVLSTVVPEYALLDLFVVAQASVSLLILWMAAEAYRNGFLPARFFFASWLCLLSGAALGIGAYKGLLPANAVTLNGLMIGALVELAVLSVALVDRHLFSEKAGIKSAFTDPQTLLPNYSFFRNRFAQALENSLPKHEKLWLVMLRIKGVDAFTGLHGPQAIAKVYALFIERLNEFLAEEPWSVPVVLPYGGESYLVSLPGDQMLLVAVSGDASDVSLERFSEIAMAPIELDGMTSGLKVELGLAFYNTGKITLQEGYRRAQLALNQCELRRTAWFVYSSELDSINKERLDLLADLQLAIDTGQLQCYLQPQFDSRRRLLGAEALVRWHHPARGMVSPGLFVPLAEQSSLVFRITQMMIESVCQWLADSEVPESFHVSVNLSLLDLLEPHLLPFIRSCVAAHGIGAGQLVFEVTETAALEGDQEFVATIEALHSMGFRVALDDFGTGYSSLLYLQRMRPDIIKVDIGFVKAIHTSEINRKIVLAIVQMAQATEALTIAEGVEDEEELMTLMRLGVDCVQGYLTGKPMPLDAFSQQFLTESADDMDFANTQQFVMFKNC